MPRGDGTGPTGGGAGTGRGMGRNPGGGGRGRNSGGAYGPGGACVCATCGATVQHQQGVSCTRIKCPNCGHTMIREELLNDKRRGRE